MTLELVTLEDRPDLAHLMAEAETEGFPRFLLEDRVWNTLFPPAVEQAPDLQVFLLDDGRPVGVGNGIALRWDGSVEDLPDGTHGALRRTEASPGRDALCLLQAVTLGEHRGAGHSAELMRRWCALATAKHLRVVSPIRAARKHQYPLIDFRRYIGWTRDGGAFDPWIRMQHRLGAEIGPVSDDALVIEATVDRWEEWTGLAMPDAGRYVIEGGQVPVEVTAAGTEGEARGRYAESHVWFLYPEQLS